MPNPQQMVRQDVPVSQSVWVKDLPERHVLVKGLNGRIFCMVDVRGGGHTQHIVYVDGTVSEQGEIMKPWDIINIINPKDVGIKKISFYRPSQSPAPGA